MVASTGDQAGTATEQPVLDALPDGVLVADGEGIVTAVNKAARKLLGRHVAPGIALKDALTLQDKEGNDWLRANDPYSGITIRKGMTEQSWFLADGTEVLVTGRIHRRAKGGPVDRVALVLRNGRGRAQLDRERSDLVATVAHELRSPLTGVKGFVTTLLSRWDRLNDEQKKLMLTTVSTDSERLSRLITELLDVARIDTGRLSLFPRELDAVPLVDRVVDSVAQGTRRTIEVAHASPAVPVFADPDKLTQVLTNIVDNAVRHGEGEVRVSTEPLEVPFPGVRIVVDDEGDGIPEAIRTRIFTKFWKHGVRGGSGLGMYLVSGLARVHGAEVEIHDAPGGGARVVVLWPADDRRN
jgi:signal transduction histidine kinase